jgi:putative phosphonate metabolism protein
MAAGERFGIYYAPALDDPLWRCGAEWLGRDAERDLPCKQPALPDIAAVTAEPRGYGFHATLKPPMRLAADATREALLDDVRSVAAGIPAFALPPLAVRPIDGFLALRETEPSPELQALADAVTAGLDRFRRPPGEAELARRRGAGLTAAQDANLLRWGYPYVFATWLFHLTLTRRLNEAETALYRPAAEAWFAGALAQPRLVADVCVFVQADAGVPFRLAERVPLPKARALPSTRQRP